MWIILFVNISSTNVYRYYLILLINIVFVIIFSKPSALNTKRNNTNIINDMNNISFRDGELAFDFSVDGGGQSIEIVVVGTVTGKEYVAEASVAAFNVSFELTATKDE